MSKINIRESLKHMDEDTFCRYDLTTMYDSCVLDDEDKKVLAKMLYDKEDPEVIYQKLCMYFDDDQVADIDSYLMDVPVEGKYESLINKCVNKLSENYKDVSYNDVANQLEFNDGEQAYVIGVCPFEDVDTDDYEVFIDYNYDSPCCFNSEEEALKYILNFIKNKVNHIDDSDVQNCDDEMIYTVYDIVEDDNNRLVAKCMNESTNDFEDIKLGKTNTNKVIELVNNLLNNPNYKITKETKDKIYKNSAPWGLAVQMTPSVDVDGTNGLLSTGDFGGDVSFGESVEINFEKDDRVTDGDREGTVIDCDSQKVLVEWDYSDTDDIEWVDKSDIYTITSMKESTNMYFTCPSCENKTLVSVDTEVKIPSDVDYHDKFICDECGEEFLSEPQFNGKIKFVKDKFEESSHISGKYVYFDYDKVGKQPTSDEVVSAFNDKYYENINSVKLDRVGYNYLQKEIEYVATDDYGHKFHVVVSHAPNPVKESVSPYKKRELKKQLQDEIYNILLHEFLTEPRWGFENIKDIDDLLGLVIEVKDYKGEYDNDFVAEIRGEFTYDELEDIGNSLDPIVQKYDKEAYFEPVTSGITRAFINIDNKIIENFSSITEKYDRDRDYLRFISRLKKANTSEEVREISNDIDNSGVATEDEHDYISLQHSVMNRLKESYGEAYNIDLEAFFAKEDLVDFAEDVCEELQKEFYEKFDISDAWIDNSPPELYVEVESDSCLADAKVKLDFRQIRQPSDIYKYKPFILKRLRSKIAPCYDDHSDYFVNESYSRSGSRKANIGLSYNSIRYKGYRISLLTDGSGYAIFDKHGEMEDHGFKSIKDAKSAIDEFNSIYKPVLSKGLSEASYGGAFDIEDDQYFTKEEIMDLADEVCERLYKEVHETFDVSDLYMDGNTLHMELESDSCMVETNVKIDMRKIRKPLDIMKYTLPITNKLLSQVKDCYNY